MRWQPLRRSRIVNDKNKKKTSNVHRVLHQPRMATEIDKCKLATIVKTVPAIDGSSAEIRRDCVARIATVH